MKCSKCQHYSRGVGRCLLGKINPPTLKGGADAMRFMGIGYVCKIDSENLARWNKMVVKLQED